MRKKTKKMEIAIFVSYLLSSLAILIGIKNYKFKDKKEK
jgi:hypothetical protein